MEACDCVESHFWPHDHEEFLMRWQYLSDCLIALAYFAITIELIYFVLKSALFPYRWVLMQFSAFIISCGATHLVSACTMFIHSKAMAAVIAVSKISCAAVSFATVLMLVHVIPDLLNVKAREQFLKDKADELGREMGLILTREESERHATVLTHQIRSSLNRDTILRKTLVELGWTLGLEDCAFWMPSRGGLTLQMSYTLNNRIQVGSSIPISLPLVTEVLSTAQAMRVPCNCPLAQIRPMVIKGIYQPEPEVVAVRVPLPDLSNFKRNDWCDFSTRSYAIMVLVLPSDGARQWHDHELDTIDVVADQVAVALSHAAILEDSMKSCDLLTEQNATLKLAQREAERAIHTRNGFLDVINDEMRTPMSAIIALALLLLETELTPEQRVVIEGILESSNLLGTFVHDVLEFSRLEDGKLELDIRTMDLHWLFKEVIKLIKPIASVKKLQMNLILAPDLPVFAIGDKKRLLQTVLNIVGNAVKFTKDGYVSITAAVGKPESLRESVSNDAGHFLLQVQVKDSGCGVKAQDKPHLFTKFSRLPNAYLTSNGAGLGLAICKRFVNLMGGHIWIDSDGLDKGTVATFIVKLGVCNNHPIGSTRNGSMVKGVIPSRANQLPDLNM